jgi:hypothetical protein
MIFHFLSLNHEFIRSSFGYLNFSEFRKSCNNTSHFIQIGIFIDELHERSLCLYFHVSEIFDSPVSVELHRVFSVHTRLFSLNVRTFGSQVGLLHFTGDCSVECDARESRAAIRASSILMTVASLRIVTDDAPLFGTHPIDNGSSVIIGYRQTTAAESEQVSSVHSAFLHVGQVNVSDSLLGSFRFCVERTEFRYCFDEALGPVRSVMLSAGGEGPYSSPAWIGNISRPLIASDGRTTFSICSFADVLSFRH